MITAALTGGAIIVRADEIDARLVQRMPGATRTQKMPPRTWHLPLCLESYVHLKDNRAHMDEALLDKVAKMKRLQDWVEKTKAAGEVEALRPPPLAEPYTLYKHQIKAYNLGFALQSFAALMDMGTGKTITTVMITGRRFLDGKISRVLIVAPTSVCAVWPREYAKFGAFPSRVATLLGERDKRIQALRYLQAPPMPGQPDPLRVAVINYESTWRLEDELRAFRPDMIVCDESQRIKNHKANQSEAMHRLGAGAKYRMILSGTPVQNNTLDVWSQYQFLNPAIFNLNYYAFERHFAVLGGVNNRQYLGPRNLDELTRKVHSIAYRVTKDECLDLPTQTFEDYAVALEDDAMALYQKIKKESVAALEAGEVTANNVLVRMLRLQQITGGFIKDDAGHISQVSTAKLDALEDIVDSYCLGEGRKLVIFSRFIEELDAIRERVGKVLARDKRGHLTQVMIRGDVKTENRGGLVNQFQKDPTCRVFIGQIDSCAEGIDLFAAHMTVYFSVNWNLAKYQQSVSRVHRIGQTHNCTYVHLVVPGTIDMKIMAALKSKEDLAHRVVDQWQTYFDD